MSERAGQTAPRTWRPRAAPFTAVWGEVEELLEAGSGWEAMTLFDGQLRPLQRMLCAAYVRGDVPE